MENNEIMELEEMENTEVIDETEETEDSGKGLFWTLLFGGAVAATVAIVMHKTRDKRKARRIEKLREEGYIVYKPEEVEELEVEENVEIEDEE